jgi:hypothetical protein
MVHVGRSLSVLLFFRICSLLSSANLHLDYGLSLNNATILNVIGYSTKNAPNAYQYLYNTALGNLIIVLAGAVPGYWYVTHVDLSPQPGLDRQAS